jgi:hypothetical protein
MISTLIRSFCRVAGLATFAYQLFAQASSGPTCTQTQLCDTLPPNLLSLSYPTTPVNVQSQGQTVNVTGTALDPLSGTALNPPQSGGVASGVAYARVEFLSSPCASQNSQTKSAWAYLSPQGVFTPGQTQNLSGSLFFSTTAANANYYACYAYIVDSVGNVQYYYQNSSQSSPVLQGLPPIQVISNPPTDVTPPALQSLTISPKPGDVTAGPATFTVSFTATDDISGVSVYYPSLIALSMVGTSNQFYEWASYQLSPIALISGDKNNGKFQAQIKIPRYSPGGTWLISAVLCDNANNCSQYSSSQLATKGFDSSVTITDSQSDTTAPQLVSLSFAQNGTTLTTNLLYPDTPITISLQTSDAPAAIGGGSSGVGFDGYSGCNPYISITSENQFPSSSNSNSTQTQFLNLSPDSSGSNSWTGTLTIPNLSEIGQWNVSVELCDRVGNYSYFTGPASSLGSLESSVYVLYQTGGVTETLSSTNRTITDPSSMTSISVASGLNPTPKSGGAPITNPYVSITTTPVPTSVTCGQSPQDPCPSPTGMFNGFKSTSSPYVSITFRDPSQCTDSNPNTCKSLDGGATLPWPGASITIPGVIPVPPPTVPGPAPTLVLWSIDGGISHVTPGCIDPSTGNPHSLNPVIDASGNVTFSYVCSFSIFYVMQKTGIAGDVNSDGVVDCQDVNIVKAAFGTKASQPGFVAQADVNHDSVVNILDLTFVLKQLAPGTTCQ